MTPGIIKKCLEAIECSEYFPYHVGAVIFKGSKIYSFGWNDVRSCTGIHNRYKNFKESLHAEQMAVSRMSDKHMLKGMSILVMRQNISGTLSMAKPCEMCREMLDHFGIRWMYYSDRRGQIIKESI